MMTKKQVIDDALARLADEFPRTFVQEKYQPHWPLKVGIAADLVERGPELDHHKLTVALTVYTRRVMYLRSLVAGAARVDLEGNPAGEVTVQDAEHAAARLVKISGAGGRGCGGQGRGCETAGAPTIAGAGSKDLNAEEKAGAAAGGIPSTALARPWCVRISDPIPSIGSELSSGGALRIIEEYADQLREIIKKLRRRPH